MTQMPFQPDPSHREGEGPDSIITAPAAGTVAGDSVFSNGLETGESSDDTIAYISADVFESAQAASAPTETDHVAE